MLPLFFINYAAIAFKWQAAGLCIIPLIHSKKALSSSHKDTKILFFSL
jgi:hypothetical protein